MQLEKRKSFVFGIVLSLFLLNAGLTNNKNFGTIDDSQLSKIIKITGDSLGFIEIDEIVNKFINEANVTGLCLAILNDNKVAFINSYGFRDIEKGIVLNEDTIMLGASFSKAVFTYLFLQLVQEGILELNEPLYKYLEKPLPEYEKYQDLNANDLWKEVTAKMCLNHTTGFPNERMFNPINPGKLEFIYEPGTKYAYSGEGISLLQFVVEELTNQSIEDLAQVKIFKPLGMNRTSYLWQDDFENNYAVGYDITQSEIQYHKFDHVSAGGSLLTTIRDFSKFIEIIMNKGGLNLELFNEMFTPTVSIKSKYQFPTISDEVTNENNSINLSYGLGWGLIFTEYGKAFFKEGHGLGFQNYTITFVDKNVSIIIMTNSENGESIFKDLLENIIGDTFTPWKWERYIPYYLIEPRSIGVYLYDIILFDGVDTAIEKYYTIKENPSKNKFIFNEGELNGLAYQMIRVNKIENAIKLFEVNVKEYPESSNVYDSLAEAYLKDEQIDLAIKNYTKALELDPTNDNAKEMLKKLK